MRLHLTGRHYVYNEATFQVLEKNIKNLMNVAKIINNSNGNLEISLLISYNSVSLSKELISKIFDFTEKVKSLGIFVDLKHKITTPGIKFYQVLFEKRINKFDIIGLFDFDQFLVYTNDQIEAVFSIAKKMIEENSLYCNCSRDVPVVLGVNKKASDLRMIHELVNSSISLGKLIADEPNRKINPSPAYRKIGEGNSGFYLINPNHKMYNNFKYEIEKNKDLLFEPGFFIEYFALNWAAINAKVTTGYVYAVENPYYTHPSPEEEIESAINSISLATKRISKTSIGKNLKNTLKNEKNLLDILKIFFDIEDIQLVLKIMKDSISTNF